MDYQQHCHRHYRQQRLRRLHTSAAAIASICAYTTVLMATPKEKAHWNDREVTALIDYLYTNKSVSEGDSGNFKMTVFNGAVAHIAPHRVQGPMKTGKMCKQKWASVHSCNLICLTVA